MTGKLLLCCRTQKISYEAVGDLAAFRIMRMYQHNHAVVDGNRQTGWNRYARQRRIGDVLFRTAVAEENVDLSTCQEIFHRIGVEWNTGSRRTTD
jgi:hypothetical protein